VVDHAIDALFVQDDHGTIVDVNRQACESLGYAPEDIIGSTPALFDPGLYRDDAFQQRNRERLDAGGIVSFETSHRRRVGASFPVEVRIRRFWEGDRPYALCSALDTTEHKRAEEERRAHLWFLESMDRINRALQGTGELEPVASAVLGELTAIFGCDRAWLVHPCDPEAASWRVVAVQAHKDWSDARRTPGHRPADATTATVFTAFRNADGPLSFEPSHGLALWPEESGLAFRAQMAIALRPRVGDPYLLGLDQCSRARAWTTEEERLFQRSGAAAPTRSRAC